RCRSGTTTSPLAARLTRLTVFSGPRAKNIRSRSSCSRITRLGDRLRRNSALFFVIIPVSAKLAVPEGIMPRFATMENATQHQLRLASRMSRLGTETAFEVLNKARALERQGKDIVHLEIGEPDFHNPANVVEA